LLIYIHVNKSNVQLAKETSRTDVGILHQ